MTKEKEHVAHTAGPWEVYDQGKDDGAGYGCFVRSTTDPLADWIACDVHNRSDAHLIAAAPDLLNALKLLDERGWTTATWDLAKKAIAKAEGK